MLGSVEKVHEPETPVCGSHLTAGSGTQDLPAPPRFPGREGLGRQADPAQVFTVTRPWPRH